MDRCCSQILVVLGLLFMTACSSVPEVLRERPDEDISLSEVITNVNAYRGRRVRWGGNIIAVRHIDGDSYIEVLSRELYDGGYPVSESTSSGRFYIKVPGFVDPHIYSKELRITVVGVLGKGKKKSIDQSTYLYPVVINYQHHLWEREYYYNPYRPYRLYTRY